MKILEAVGYIPVGTWPYSDWKFPDGTDLPTIRVYVPLESVAPTSYQVGKIWTEQMHPIGLNNIVLTPEDYSSYLRKTYDEWDFEISWNCHLVGRFPDYLYTMFHSSELCCFPNSLGIYWPALDEQLEILKFGLDHAAKVEAAKKAQELVAGGTPASPLPIPAPTDDNHWNWSLASLPVHSRDSMTPNNLSCGAPLTCRDVA